MVPLSTDLEALIDLRTSLDLLSSEIMEELCPLRTAIDGCFVALTLVSGANGGLCVGILVVLLELFTGVPSGVSATVVGLGGETVASDFVLILNPD